MLPGVTLSVTLGTVWPKVKNNVYLLTIPFDFSSANLSQKQPEAFVAGQRLLRSFLGGQLAG